MRPLATLLAALAAVSGCGPAEVPTYPVSGTVKFRGGPPVAAGVIEFAPAGGGPAARGKIEPGGRFTLTTGDRPGAVAGEHRVAIVQMVAPTEGLSAEARAHALKHRVAVIHRKYARFETSGLTRRVEAGKENEFVFEVDPAD